MTHLRALALGTLICALGGCNSSSGGGGDASPEAGVQDAGGMSDATIGDAQPQLDAAAIADAAENADVGVVDRGPAPILDAAIVDAMPPDALPPPLDEYDRTVLLEVTTGAWCQFCPNAAVIREDLRVSHPGRVAAVSIHNGDRMQEPRSNELLNGFLEPDGVPSFPTAAVDRIPAEDDQIMLRQDIWRDAAFQRRGIAAPCGLTLDARTPGRAQIAVECALDAPVAPRLTVYLLEDGITGRGNGYDQVNFYNNQAGHPYQGAGNPIIGFVHDRVVRAVLTDPLDGLPIELEDGRWSGEIEYVVPEGSVVGNLSITAFVADAPSPPQRVGPVLNAIDTFVGTRRTWADEGEPGVEVEGGFGACPADESLMDTWLVTVPEDGSELTLRVDTRSARSTFQMGLFRIESPGVYLNAQVSEVFERDAMCRFPSPDPTCPSITLAPGVHEIGVLIWADALRNCLNPGPAEYLLEVPRPARLEPRLNDVVFPFER